VINLARRGDRRQKIEELCTALRLRPTFVTATDGLALKAQGGSFKKLKVLRRSRSRGAQQFQGEVAEFKACWFAHGHQQQQLIRMATHRLQPTLFTEEGYELWGTVGCNLSHQDVLQRFLSHPTTNCCLVLEDDATMKISVPQAQRQFSKGLVYLRGSVASYDRTGGRLDETLVRGRLIYHSHAYVIRRQAAEFVLRKLQEGFSADAALMSWTRTARDRCFLFTQPQIMVHPGRAAQWRDSDILAKGAELQLRRGLRNRTKRPRWAKQTLYHKRPFRRQRARCKWPVGKLNLVCSTPARFT